MDIDLFYIYFSDFICLWCNEKGRTFYSLDAVRKHMNDKGHCKMLHEGLALVEYSDFYDYSSSYPDNVSCHAKHKNFRIIFRKYLIITSYQIQFHIFFA